MLIQLTRGKKVFFVQLSAVLSISPRFFFKGSVIRMMGGVKHKCSQAPDTIIGSLATMGERQVEAKK